MNKTFIVAFFAFLTLGQSLEPARQFVTAFLKSSTGEDVQLSDQCLGATFDKNLAKIKKYIQSENITLLLLTLQALYSDISKNCPIDKFTALASKIQQKVTDKSILDDIDNKLNDATKLIMKEYKNPTHTGESIGTTAGGIIAVFIREHSKFLAFIEKNRLRLEMDVITIVEGVLLGLGKDETCTKCHDDIVKHKDDIVEIIKELIEAIKSGTDIVQAIIQAITKVMGMFEVVGDCRLLEFAIAIQKIGTPEGVQQIIERIKENVDTFILLAQEVYEAINKKDDLAIGIPIGKGLKIALDFYVN